MQIKNIVEFDKKRYFGGAIQANWFYEADKSEAITESYVFHGPRYHGVSESVDARYKLYDTASYALDLLKRANDKESNKFCLTIAGYGTGKSHLAVALASLMSGHSDRLRNAAIERIAAVDRKIAEEVSSYTDRNLVLVYNGMNNFNLDYETLSIAKKALKQHGISGDVLNTLTKQYDQAKHFVETTFTMLESRYKAVFSDICLENNCNKEYIIDHIDNSAIFDAVNTIYKEINGSFIQWERGISAGDILTLLERTFCCEQKVFNKIIVLFDEFGRYIEYTAANPAVAGESALQQVFEAIQNADGNILFDGFIQSDLSAYLSRIDKSSNIIRYVGRYEISDKYYISSNFETILANLITKKDEEKFKDIVEHNIDETYSAYHNRVYSNLIRWNKTALSKSVWSDKRLYDTVISKGCYPIHPFAVWLLSNTSAWMQQRSTIAFAEEMFASIENNEISAKWLEYIYAVDIIDSSLFSEMLNSEEKGLVQSQYCMLFRDIMLKNGDKMSDDEKTVLKAILIIDLCKFAVADRNDCIDAVKYCSKLSEAEITAALNGLENNHGVISFDSNTNRFDLMAEANGMNEFKREYIRKKLMVNKYNGVASCDDELSQELNLSAAEETSFAMERKINSSEWCFEKRLMCAADFNNDYCKSLGYYFDNAVDGETPRGIIIYLYCGKNADRDIEYVQKLYVQYSLDKVPLIIYLLSDEEEKLLDVLRSREALRRFSPSEKDRFSRFIAMYSKEFTKRISKTFKEMLDERKFIGVKGIEISDMRLRNMCLKAFESAYPKTIPFAFDGFEKKVTPQAKKNFAELCSCMYNGTMTNAQMYQSLSPQLKNRIQAVLSTATTQTSWQVLDSRYRLCEPQNSSVKRIYNDVREQITPDTVIGIGQLFNKYMYAPYGMNKYCLSLFIIFFISHNSGKIQLLQGDSVLKKADFIQNVLQNDKKMLESLMRLKIKLSDKTDDDMIEELCHNINENKYVEYSISLGKKLDAIKSDMDDISPYKEKFATAEMYLADGKRLYEQLYTNGIVAAEKSFADIEEKFSLPKLAAIYGKIQRRIAGTQIDEYSNYVYSEEYCNRAAALLSKADALLDKKFTSHIKSLKCSVSEISQFKSAYTKVAKQLVKIDRKDYADSLSERVKEVVSEVGLQQKYGQTFALVDKELAFIGTAADLDYYSCEEQLKNLGKWTDFFSAIDDLDKKVIDDYLTKISAGAGNIENRIKEIQSFIDQLFDEISNGISDIDAFYLKVTKILDLKPADDTAAGLQDMIKTIDEYRNMIKNSEADIYTIERLTSEYDSKWSNTVCANAMKAHISALKKAVAAKRQMWFDDNIADMAFKVEGMSAAACVQWQNRCAECPNFLTEDDIVELHNVRELVNSRLKSLKIQGVVEMFNELSDAEKIECLRLLNMQ